MPRPEIIDLLLRNRNIPKEDWNQFLDPSYDTDIHDPFLMKDMEKAVLRMMLAIRNGEKIAFYADYDADGIPGAVILSDFFRKIKYTNTVVYIPDRHVEGYGLNKDAVTELASQSVSLIITIDLGITGHSEILHAQEFGMDVIVTDHHIPHETLPGACAILNPKQSGCDYPYKDLCGSGVAFKLVQACIRKIRDGEYKDIFPSDAIPVGWEKWLLDMVGLATLSDMVPLLGENRVFASYGLQVLRKTRRAGLLHLYKKLKIAPQYLTEEDITFMITPRLNVASRLDSPMRAFEMLGGDDVLAIQAAEILIKLNTTRKTLVASIMKKVHERLAVLPTTGIIVIGEPSWRPGVLGLVASKIVEIYKRPAFVWGGEDGIYKGSCRSDGSVHVVELMHYAKNIFNTYGGHEAAGGFSFPESALFDLHSTLEEAYMKIKNNTESHALYAIDASLSLSDITESFYKNLAMLAPFGVANSKPVFSFPDITISNIKHFGGESEHLELTCTDGSVTRKAIAFFKTAVDFPKVKLGVKCTLIATIEKSYFLNRPELRLRIVDVQ